MSNFRILYKRSHVTLPLWRAKVACDLRREAIADLKRAIKEITYLKEQGLIDITPEDQQEIATEILYEMYQEDLPVETLNILLLWRGSISK